jgi:hypothetical protein
MKICMSEEKSERAGYLDCWNRYVGEKSARNGARSNQIDGQRTQGRHKERAAD